MSETSAMGQQQPVDGRLAKHKDKKTPAPTLSIRPVSVENMMLGNWLGMDEITRC
jgi:hypothetical protein